MTDKPHASSFVNAALDAAGLATTGSLKPHTHGPDDMPEFLCCQCHPELSRKHQPKKEHGG